MKYILFIQIRTLTVTVWREAIRNRVMLVLTASGISFIILSLILGRLAVGGLERVIQNMGFWILGIWGLVSVIYIGSNIVKQEIQQKTVYMILSRPVNRVTFLIGKFSGILMVLATIFAILSAVWMILMFSQSIPLSRQHLLALLFIFGEWILLASFSLFFATFTSPLLHGFFLFGIYILGHWSRDLRIFSENADEAWIQAILKLIYFMIPNLDALNFREAALFSEPLSSGMLIHAVTVLIGWILSALIAANLIFTRRRLL